jgi:hypothetical protein
MIHTALVWFRGSLRDPSWIAAYALLTQVFIFWWQARILRRHAATLEEHTRIAGTQATTADLVRQALQRQEAILKDQFKLQRQLEAQSERRIMFDLITRLLTSVYSLTAKLTVVQYTSPREIEEIRDAWTRMDNDATVCRMALIGSEYMSEAESRHFTDYLDDIRQLKQTNAGNNADYHQLRAFNERHKDFLTVVAENRKAAVRAIVQAV